MKAFKVDEDGGLVIDISAMEWRNLAPGVDIKVLRLDRESGAWTIMIQAEKGAVLPPHRHDGIAEIYIIEGAGSHPETGNFKAGDYVLESDGAIHSALPFEEKVVQIMVSHGPSSFLNEDGSTSFVMDVNMLTGFAEETVVNNA